MTTDSEIMFDLAPVSLWLEDYSALHRLFAQWRAAGVTDLRAHLHADRNRVGECTRQLKVVKVNQHTLELFEARDTAHLVTNLAQVFRDAMLEAHVDGLVALWEGWLCFSSQTVNYTVGGRRLDILVHGRVLPGHHDDWSRVLIAIENISERTRAQAHLAHSERYARGLFAHSPVSLWSRISAPSSGCWTTCVRAASKTFACSRRSTRSSRSAACARSA